MPYKYKAKNGQDFFVPEVGASKNGVLESPVELESPNLELVTDTAEAQPVQGQQTAQPGAVIGVAPQATVTPQPAVAPVQSTAPQSQTSEDKQ